MLLTVKRIVPLTSCSHPDESQRVLFPARDYITGDAFTVERCSRCGLDRTVPQVAPEDMDRYYPPGYYGAGQRYPRPLEWLLDCLYSARAEEIERRVGTVGRVLDIGCGRGSLLAQFRRRGWTVAGTELSETSARYARDILGVNVQTGDVQDLDLGGPYDLVVLWHVMEHIADPAGLLEKVAAVLAPEGTVLVAVPNFGSPEARLGRSRWFHLDVPRHLNHVTRTTLVSMVGKAGLEPYDASYFALEYDFFSFVQTMLNLLGIRQNLLYDLLRTRGAKVLEGQTGGTRSDVLRTILLAPLLGAASLVWVPVAAASGRGATIALYARKPTE